MKGRRVWLINVASGLLAVLVTAGFLASPASAVDKATVTLDWIFYGKHAGFFAGIDTGLYRKYGLDITIQRGYGSAETVKQVSAKSIEYGFADFGSLIVARSRGAKAKMLAVIHAKSLVAIMTLEGTGIRTPKDLEGKRLGITQGGAGESVFPVLLAKNRVDESKIQMINLTPPAHIPSLIAGKIDASLAIFQTSFPTVEAKAKEIGKRARSILFSDYGVDILSNGLVAHDDTISNRRDKTRRWVEATMRSFAWAVRNPDEAMKIFLKYAPTVDPKLGRAHWDINVKHLLVPEAKTHGIGYMLPGRVAFAIDTLTKPMNLPRRVSNDEVADMSLLPKIVLTE